MRHKRARRSIACGLYSAHWDGGRRMLVHLPQSGAASVPTQSLGTSKQLWGTGEKVVRVTMELQRTTML